jgi:cytochrome c oxidase cbb3-type subunit 3
MSTRAMAAFVAAVALVAATGCEREARRLATSSPPAQTIDGPRQGDLRPGQPGPGMPATAGGQFNDHNALEVANGKRLFRWYNCNGCHGGGGGAYGPALSDDQWLYGSAPDSIYATIMEGRPNGMPSFRGRIPEAQAWQLVAYVRSLSGQVAKDVAPGRGDGIQGGPAEAQRDRQFPFHAEKGS